MTQLAQTEVGLPLPHPEGLPPPPQTMEAGTTANSVNPPTGSPDGGGQTQAGVPAPLNEPIFKHGNKSFTNKEELSEHLQRLTEEKIAAEAYAKALKDSQTMAGSPKVTTPSADEDMAALENEFFTNPTATLKKIEERAVAKAVSQLTSQTTHEKQVASNWESFFKQNPDLNSSGAQWVVNTLMREVGNDPKWKTLTWEDGSAKLAQLARVKMKELGMAPGTTTVQLPSSPAVTAPTHPAVGNSGGSQAPAAQKPVDLSNQLKHIQKKRARG